MNARLSRSMLLLLVTSLIAASCMRNDGEQEQGNNTVTGGVDKPLTIALDSDPKTLDPQLSDDSSSRAVVNNIYESLLARDGQTGDLIPWLAVEMPKRTSDTTWRFELRDDATFSNGEPFNADAVVASVERELDPDYPSEQLGFYTGMVGAEAADEFTVDINTEAFDPILPSRMAFFKIVPPEASQNKDFAQNPVGTGPYLFVERTVGESITLEKNPDYWGDEPVISDVTYRIITDDSTRVAALQSGEVHVVRNLPPESAEQVPNFLTVPGQEAVNVMLKNEPGLLTGDVRVREALNLAIDKESIAGQIFSGYAEPLKCQTIPPPALGHNPNLEPVPYDPERAEELIQEAGATGKELRFVGLAGIYLKSREVEQFLTASWQAIGLEIDFQELEVEAYLEATHAEVNRPELIYHQSSNDLLDADRQVSTYFISTSSNSPTDDALDGLAAQARSEKDVAKRQQLYEELTQKACETFTHVFLILLDDTYGTSEDLVWEPRVDEEIFVKEMSFSG